MKKRTNIWICFFAVIGVVLLLSGSCKKDKDEDNPVAQVPVFTVTANTVQLQGGGEGLQFFAKCTNEDVKMTKVTYYDLLPLFRQQPMILMVILLLKTRNSPCRTIMLVM